MPISTRNRSFSHCSQRNCKATSENVKTSSESEHDWFYYLANTHMTFGTINTDVLSNKSDTSNVLLKFCNGLQWENIKRTVIQGRT